METLIAGIGSAAGWSAAAAWLTLIAVFVSLVSLVLIGKQIGETRTLRLDQARPYVIVDFDSTRGVRTSLNVIV